MLERPPIDGTPPGKTTLHDALLEQWKREAGTGVDPDAYLYRYGQPTEEPENGRGEETEASQPK